MTLAPQPDCTLPQQKDDAELFHIKTYSTAILCYQPTLRHAITIEQPMLDAAQLLSYDDDIRINPKAIPFIISQPTEREVELLNTSRSPHNQLPHPGRSAGVPQVNLLPHTLATRASSVLHR